MTLTHPQAWLWLVVVVLPRSTVIVEIVPWVEAEQVTDQRNWSLVVLEEYPIVMLTFDP